MDMQQSRGPTATALIVHEFTTEYKVDAEGEPIEVDYVEYSPRHKEGLTRIVAPVAKILEIDEDEDPNNLSAAIARSRAAIIEPQYRAWKKGSEVTVNGTPFGAWHGINAKQANILRHAGFSSVEEVASATRSQIMKVRLPNQMDLQLLAKNFLAAKGASVEASNMARVQQENEHLKSELDDMKQNMAQLMAMVKGDAANVVTPAVEIEAEDKPVDEELAILRDMAKEAGIDRYWVKGKETLERELEAVTEQAA